MFHQLFRWRAKRSIFIALLTNVFNSAIEYIYNRIIKTFQSFRTFPNQYLRAVLN